MMFCFSMSNCSLDFRESSLYLRMLLNLEPRTLMGVLLPLGMMGNPYWSTSPEGATVMSMTMGISSSLMGAGGASSAGGAASPSAGGAASPSAAGAASPSAATGASPPSAGGVEGTLDGKGVGLDMSACCPNSFFTGAAGASAAGASAAGASSAGAGAGAAASSSAMMDSVLRNRSNENVNNPTVQRKLTGRRLNV